MTAAQGSKADTVSSVSLESLPLACWGHQGLASRRPSQEARTGPGHSTQTSKGTGGGDWQAVSHQASHRPDNRGLGGQLLHRDRRWWEGRRACCPQTSGTRTRGGWTEVPTPHSPEAHQADAGEP